MKIFKTRLFHQWAEEIGLDDAVLCKATEELIQGQYEANLGGYLYKKRIAFGGKGKSSGLRTIIAFRREDKTFFVYGFAKNKRDNIRYDELYTYKEVAKTLFSCTEQQIRNLVDNKKLIEVVYE